MSAQTDSLLRPEGDAPKTEHSIKQPERYQSSEIVAAATELKFKQKNKAQQEGKDGEGDKYEQDIKSCQKKSKDEVAEMFNTNLIEGLTDIEVSAAREVYGWNELTPSYEHPW